MKDSTWKIKDLVMLDNYRIISYRQLGLKDVPYINLSDLTDKFTPIELYSIFSLPVVGDDSITTKLATFVDVERNYYTDKLDSESEIFALALAQG